jgi:hypothetical protein
MMFAGWLRPHRVLIAVAVVAAGVLACRDTTTPKEVSTAGVAFDPLSTDASPGFISVVIGRGNLGPFRINSKAAGYHVDLKSPDNTDIAVANITIAPGAHSGWHYHPGPVLVVVKTGSITFYHSARSREDGEGADDAACPPTRYNAGSTFTESGGVVGIARNEGTVEATAVATFFAPPAPSPLRIGAPKPANCA